jgi:hypothetical protein
VARVTVRLPDELHERLVVRGRATGKSLNQFIVDSVRSSLDAPAAAKLSARERLEEALGDLLATPAEKTFVEPDDEETPLLSHEELQRIMPRLTPSLSASIIADREDRF